MIKTDDYESAKTASLRLLSYRARSKAELKERLVKKGFTADIIKQVLVELNRLGLVNDNEFARTWVESRIRSKPMGAGSLRWELKQRGINDKLAATAVKTALGENGELRLARELLQMRLRRLGMSLNNDSQLNKKDYVKLVRFLSGRGFPYQVIKQVLRSYFKTSWSEEF